MQKTFVVLCATLAVCGGIFGFSTLPLEARTSSLQYLPPQSHRYFASSDIPASTSTSQIIHPFAKQYLAQQHYQPAVYSQYPAAYVKQSAYPSAPYYPQQTQYIGSQPGSYYIPPARYPPSGSSDEAGTTGSGGEAAAPSWWQQFGNYLGSYYPNYPSNYPSYFPGISTGSEGSQQPANNPQPSGGAAETPSNSASGVPSKTKPEKIELAEESKDTEKQETDSVSVTAAENGSGIPLRGNPTVVGAPALVPQYVLLGQPQFFGHFASLPALAGEREALPVSPLQGSISSFLFYNPTQNSQPTALAPYPPAVVTQDEGLGEASEAFQKFLFLNKRQRAPGRTTTEQVESATSSTPSYSTTTNQQQASSTTSEPEFESVRKSVPDRSAAQAKPNAIAYAGIGGMADAAPVGTAVTGERGLSSASPSGTAIAGTSKNPPTLTAVPAAHKRFANKPVAKYTPERGYHVST